MWFNVCRLHYESKFCVGSSPAVWQAGSRMCDMSYCALEMHRTSFCSDTFYSSNVVLTHAANVTSWLQPKQNTILYCTEGIYQGFPQKAVPVHIKAIFCV